MNSDYTITTTSKLKINGVLFQQNENRMIEDNVDAAIARIEAALKKWSTRNFTTLGKILLVKTFGFSQVVFLLQSLVIGQHHYKKLNHLFYKFIWNKHFLAAKAPERVSREILTTPVINGGYGMLDLEKLDMGLKIKGVGRLMVTNHPFLTKIKNSTNFLNYFYPTNVVTCENFSTMGLKYLSNLRLNSLTKNLDLRNPDLIRLIRSLSLQDIVSPLGKNSLIYHNVRARGARRVRDLSSEELVMLRHFVVKEIVDLTIKFINIRIDGDVSHLIDKTFHKNKFVALGKLNGKQIRTDLSNFAQICSFKFGVNIEPKESKTWFSNVKKVTSTKHKNTLLRVIHGEIYTKEKMHRFGMIPSPFCPRCGEIENLEHKFVSCQYVKLIWIEIVKLTNKLRPTIGGDEVRRLIDKKDILGITNPTPTVLAIHAEMMQRILALKDDLNFLIRPKVLARLVVTNIKVLEKNNVIKEDLENILLE